MNDNGFTTGWLLGCVLAVACGMLSWTSSQDTERAAAIKAGVAQYVVNPQTGETQFVYLKPEATK